MFTKEQFSNEQCNIFRLLILILVIFLVVLIIWLGVGINNKVKEGRYIGQEIESKNTISVSDKAEVYVRPDLALTTFSVKTEKKTVSQALADNTEKMNAIIDFMKESGVEEKDLKTTTFNIYPRYEFIRETGIFPPPSSKRVLVGYEVIQSLQVKIRDLEKIGQLIEGATEAGANQVGDLQFTVDEPDDFKKQAREEAITKARAKAREIANQLGVDLVRITNFAESSQLPRYFDFALAEAAVGGAGAVPQIETGQNKIEVTVSITYEID